MGLIFQVGPSRKWPAKIMMVNCATHKNPPTPCLWQAPASTQKYNPENQKGNQEERELLADTQNAHAVPLASARQHPENQKENQAGHSSERKKRPRKERVGPHGDGGAPPDLRGPSLRFQDG